MSGAFCSSVSFNVYSSTKVPGSWDTAKKTCLIISSWYLTDFEQVPSNAFAKSSLWSVHEGWSSIWTQFANESPCNLQSAHHTKPRCLHYPIRLITQNLHRKPIETSERVKMYLARKKLVYRFMCLCHLSNVTSIPIKEGHYCVIPKSHRSKSWGRLGICLHTRVDKPAMPKVTHRAEQEQQS